MKLFQVKNVVDQKNIKNWIFIPYNHEFKKQFVFGDLSTKRIVGFVNLLMNFSSDKYAVTSCEMRAGTGREVSVRVKEDLDKNEIDEVLVLIDEAFEDVKN